MNEITNFQEQLSLRRECENRVLKRLQKQIVCGSLALDEISDIESEVSEEMNKLTYIKEVERRTGKKPEPIPNDPTGRWGWRVNGRNEYFPRGKDANECYEKQWRYHLKQIEKNRFSQITLQDLIYKHCKEQRELGVPVNTVKAWHSYVKFYLNDQMERTIGSFTQNELLDLYKKAIIKKRPCPTTVKNARNDTRRFFIYATKDLHEKLQFDPNMLWSEMKENTPVKYLTIKNTPILFEQSNDDYSSSEMLSMINEAYKRDTILAYSSILSLFINVRISEISGLLLENVDLDRGIIYIKTAYMRNNETNQYELNDPKGHKKRAIALPSIAFPIFKRILELRNPNSIYLLAERNNKCKDENVCPKRIDRSIRSMNEAIGMKVVKSAHDQRRTYCKILDSVALPTALRKLLMGHSLDALEKAYMKTVDYNPEEVRALIDKGYDRFLDKKRTGIITI